MRLTFTNPRPRGLACDPHQGHRGAVQRDGPHLRDSSQDFLSFPSGRYNFSEFAFFLFLFFVFALWLCVALIIAMDAVQDFQIQLFFATSKKSLLRFPPQNALLFIQLPPVTSFFYAWFQYTIFCSFLCLHNLFPLVYLQMLFYHAVAFQSCRIIKS